MRNWTASRIILETPWLISVIGGGEFNFNRKKKSLEKISRLLNILKYGI